MEFLILFSLIFPAVYQPHVGFRSLSQTYPLKKNSGKSYTKE